MKNHYAIFLITLILIGCSSSQFSYETPSRAVPVDSKHVRVAANENYNKVSKSKKFFLGDHYRREWATPVDVEIFNLDSLAGELIPSKMGGGMQTKSLRLDGANGKEYVLRSINKDPSKALPPEFVGTFADNVIQDQISSSNPYASLAIASLAETAGVFHSEPRIVFVQATPSLGEFNNEFGNTLCLFEERPIGNQEDNPAFGNSKRIVTSAKLFEKLADDNNHRVDQQAFLSARLFDIWIGDWDRHEDQWVWASFKSGEKTFYKPIPRDRDQAFANLDGVIPQLAARKWAVRKTQNFDYTIRDVNGLNQNGNYLDRMFMQELTLQQWERIARELSEKLTDDKIENAFTRMPPEIYEISGRETIAKLKRRRDDLLLYAKEYYEFLSTEVNIVGTDKSESFEVNRLNNDSTEVIVKGKSKKGKENIVFQRTFLRDETKEIRLYGLGGADEFILDGTSTKGPLVRIIGGDGKDYVLNYSSKGASTLKTKIYDNEPPVLEGTQPAQLHISNDTLKTVFNKKWFRYDLLAPKLAPGYSQDDGIFIGGGLTFKKYQFGKPFGYSQSIWGNYAFKTGAYNFQYDARIVEVIGKWDLDLHTRINAPNFIYNYYGLGNETAVIQNNWSFHRVRMKQLITEPTMHRKFGEHNDFKFGLTYQSMEVERSEDRFVTTTSAGLDSTLFHTKNFAGIIAGFQNTRVDNPFYPRKGFRTGVKLEHIVQLGEGRTEFTKVSSQFSYYTSFNSVTLAFRVGGAAISNDSFQFYQAATLGGMDNLRGYRRTRFAGQYSFYQNTEVRLKLGNSGGYTLRGSYGLLGFVDVGRVWVKSEDSNTWHTGMGAGAWFLPYNKMTFTATYEVSRDTNLFNIRAGFLF